MSKHRLFIAIPLPEKLVEYLKLELELQDFKDHSNPSNWHITLLFIGNTEADKIDVYKKKLESFCQDHKQLTLQPFQLVTKSQRRGEMLWATFMPSITFETICEELALFYNFKLNRKPLPHITLARSKKSLARPFNTNLSYPEFTIDKIELWESNLSNKNPTYSCISSCNLRAIV